MRTFPSRSIFTLFCSFFSLRPHKHRFLYFNHDYGGDISDNGTITTALIVITTPNNPGILFSRSLSTNTLTMCQMILTAVVLVRVRRVTVITPVTTHLTSRIIRRPMITRRWNTTTSWRKTRCLLKRCVSHNKYHGREDKVSIPWSPTQMGKHWISNMETTKNLKAATVSSSSTLYRIVTFSW